MSLTFTDIFCGAGGSSLGLAAAGFDLRLAANHWRTAIDTHAANFRDAEHLCADVNNYDMRRLPRTDVLWASPICTEASPASGTTGYRRPKRVAAGQLELLEAFGHVPKAGMERTRATFHDVIRATEVHRYLAVIVENVPDVVDRWELFDWWVHGMRSLRPGYRVQVLSVNSAHIGGDGNPWAPQWRDRLKLVFTRLDVPAPDLTLRPTARCARCGRDVPGVQTWAPSTDGKPYRVGRYRRDRHSSYGQYWYTCPRCGRRVEPYVLPAAAAIDWTDLGQRIADLPRPLAAATLRRIETGLRLPADPARIPPLVPAGAFLGNANHDDTRVYPANRQPLPARTTKTGDWVCTPLLVPPGGTWATQPTTVAAPMRTRTANPKGFEALACPEPFLAVLRRHATTSPIGEPLPTVTAGGNHHALVVPYYSTGTPRPASQPFDTVTSRDRFALIHPTEPPPTEPAPAGPRSDGAWPAAVPDCRFRMVKPRESLRAQRFPDSYRVLGNLGEQTMQAGNAVSANVAQWIGQRLAAALGAAA
jgi:DNA (cytosine-5)-methyltransferase 1